MYLNTLIFILGIGLVQGVLITAVLMSQKKIQPFHLLLNTYIAVILVQLVFKLVSKIWLVQNWHQAYLLSYFLPFLYGPLMFLFAISYLDKGFKWKWKYTLHFLPFLIYVSFFVFANPDDYQTVIMIFLFHPFSRFAL